jgi:hypothetical protein
MSPTRAEILPANDGLPRRLRLRYYWTQPDTRAVRRTAGSLDWRLVHVVEATDVIIYDVEIGRTALVTSRTPGKFKKVSDQVQVLLRSIDETAQITVDHVAASVSNDFFLWLFYRNQSPTARHLVEQDLVLQGVTALSSMSANKGARFKDGATLDRIELVALIAVATGKFGPAKFSVASGRLDAGFDLELHLDGGFQPYRTSKYDEQIVGTSDFGPKVFDDMWMTVLPALRAAYEADESWEINGKAALQASCVASVQAALDVVLGFAKGAVAA